MTTRNLSAIERQAILASDPDDPSTWPVWDQLGLETFGPSYQDGYRQIRKTLKTRQ